MGTGEGCHHLKLSQSGVNREGDRGGIGEGFLDQRDHGGGLALLNGGINSLTHLGQRSRVLIAPESAVRECTQLGGSGRCKAKGEDRDTVALEGGDERNGRGIGGGRTGGEDVDFAVHVGGLGDECRQSRLEGRAGDTGIGRTAGKRINRRLDRDAVGVADNAGDRQCGRHRVGVGDQTDTITHSGAVNQGAQRGLKVGALAGGEAGGAVNHDLEDRVAVAECGDAGKAGGSTIPDDVQLVPGGRLVGGQLN